MIGCNRGRHADSFRNHLTGGVYAHRAVRHRAEPVRPVVRWGLFTYILSLAVLCITPSFKDGNGVGRTDAFEGFIEPCSDLF